MRRRPALINGRTTPAQRFEARSPPPTGGRSPVAPWTGAVARVAPAAAGTGGPPSTSGIVGEAGSGDHRSGTGRPRGRVPRPAGRGRRHRRPPEPRPQPGARPGPRTPCAPRPGPRAGRGRGVGRAAGRGLQAFDVAVLDMEAGLSHVERAEGTLAGGRRPGRRDGREPQVGGRRRADGPARRRGRDRPVRRGRQPAVEGDAEVYAAGAAGPNGWPAGGSSCPSPPAPVADRLTVGSPAASQTSGAERISRSAQPWSGPSLRW